MLQDALFFAPKAYDGTPGIVAEVRPVDDETRQIWRSGQNRSTLQVDKRFWEPQVGSEKRANI